MEKSMTCLVFKESLYLLTTLWILQTVQKQQTLIQLGHTTNELKCIEDRTMIKIIFKYHHVANKQALSTNQKHGKRLSATK